MNKGDRLPQEPEGKKISQQKSLIAEDVNTLHSLGYAQELLRRMSGFSSFAVSFSIICILSSDLNLDIAAFSISPIRQWFEITLKPMLSGNAGTSFDEPKQLQPKDGGEQNG